MCGSGPATAAAIGSIMIPAMVKKGYDKDFSAALTATSGTLGIVIPPSNPMIIYAVIANVSVTAMFITGFLPGILMGVGLIAMSMILAYRRRYGGTAGKDAKDKLLRLILRNFPALLKPVIILGGIYLGVFTPVEAEVVAVVYSLVVSKFINKKMNIRELYECLKMANVVSGSIIILISASTLFGQFLTVYQVPIKISNFMLSLSSDPTVILLLIAGLLVFLGCFMETLATIIILTPIFLPLTSRIGVDPLHLGMIFIVGGVIGFCTPPLGVNLFVSASLTNLTLERVAKATLIFYIPMLLVYLVLVLFPDITLILPRLILGYR
jgi:C4-dicarboxylate transporter DctM subunit